MGVLANTAAVIIGSLLGMLFKGGLKQKYQDILMQALGLSTMFIGASGTLSKMLVISDNSISVQGTMMIIANLVIGALVGEFMDIEQKLELFGEWLKKKVKRENDSKFVDGFVTSSLVICVGAMAIVGSLQDGLVGDPSTLYTKAILDFVIVMVFSSTLGIGVLFSALPIFVYQGAIYLFAGFLSPYLTTHVINNLTLVGNILIFAVGVNLCFGKKIKVGNLLPAMIIPFFF